jgi:hypothetical protein
VTLQEIGDLVRMMRREKVAEIQVGDVRIALHVFAYAPEVATARPGEPEEQPKAQEEPFDPLFHSTPLDPALQKPENEPS